MVKTEEWRDIPGWEGFYQVSDLGRVKSLARTVRNGIRTGGTSIAYRVRERILQQTLSGNTQRPAVTLYRDGRSSVFQTHRLVLRAFVGEPPEGMECCHNDGDHTHNTLANLRWDTSSNNKLDNVRLGTHNNARKTECFRGHPFDDENTYKPPAGSRKCKVCRRLRETQYRSKKRAAA